MRSAQKFWPVLFIFIGLSCGKVPMPDIPDEPLHFNGNFENGNISAFHQLLADSTVNAVVVSSPVRSGNFALRNTHRPEDYVFNGYRSELAVFNCAQYGTEVYYGFSFMIDSTYSDNQFNIICQWQDVPDFLAGEGWSQHPQLHGSSPPLAVVYADGKISLNANDNPSSDSHVYLIGDAMSISKNTWYDVAAHIRWSDDETAFVELMVNGNFLTHQNGNDHKFYHRNLFNRSGNYFKFGQYRGKEKTSAVNTIYFDEIKIGTSWDEIRP